MKCRQGKEWTEEDKKVKSNSAKKSKKVTLANKILGENKKSLFVGPRKNGYRLTKQNTCLVCNEKIFTTDKMNANYHAKCWQSVSGGYRKGSSRGKCGWYKEYWCDSSWELAWVIYNLEHEIKFERNKNGFDYEFENKIHKYYPDFILEDGTYIEIKNYNNEQVKAKLKFFKNPIKVLYRKELKEVFEYVIKKYGKNYINLYKKIEYECD